MIECPNIASSGYGNVLFNVLILKAQEITPRSRNLSARNLQLIPHINITSHAQETTSYKHIKCDTGYKGILNLPLGLYGLQSPN